MEAGMLQKIQEKKSSQRSVNWNIPQMSWQEIFLKNRTGIIGVLVPDLDHPFFSAFARETEIALYKAGYKVMICNTIGSSNRELDYLNTLDRNMVDGIITGSHTLHVEEYLKRKRTIVSLNQDFGPEIPMVGSDDIYGGRAAAEIILKNKCRKVLHITGVAPNVAANDRHAIFESILAEHGVEIVDLMMEWNKFDHQAYWDAAREAIRKCDGIDGVFAETSRRSIICILQWRPEKECRKI